PCHKSHFDYLLTGWLMFVKGMAVPLIAAGNNLLFWPVGQLMRYTTAFFLRRSFKGLDLYAQVFAAYLRVLLQESWNIKVFIEGGRSRTGKLLQPKLGMLSFLVQAVDEGETEDLTFIPVFLGYDENPEEGSYLRELSGNEKTKESFLEVLRARKVLSRKYGKVFVRFHDPISYKDFRRNWSEKASASGDTSSPDLVKALAYRVMTGIVRAGVVTGVELASAGLLSRPGPDIPHARVLMAASHYCEYARWIGLEIQAPLEGKDDPAVSALARFVVRGLITKSSGEGTGGATYTIQESKRPNLGFYRNGLLNGLWPASIAATIMLMGDRSRGDSDRAMRDDFGKLLLVLSQEIIFDPLMDEARIFDETMSFFGRCGWTTDHENMDALQDFRSLLRELLELYYLVLRAVGGLREKTGIKSLIKAMTKEAVEIRQSGKTTIGPPPSFSTVTVRNAVKVFGELGVIHPEDGGKAVSPHGESDSAKEWKDFLMRMCIG
ncbi:MAG: 1-acyl-sn-glycerol-3-phosphate acyltransferase, partial [Pseudomonadota bacterium]